MRRFSALVALLTLFGLAATDFAAGQPDKKEQPKQKTHVDQFGDPLPEGAFARLGTTRYRHGGRDLLGFSADGKSVLYLGGGSLSWLDVATGKEVKSVRLADDVPRGLRRFEQDSGNVLSADGSVLAFSINRGNSSISIVDTATGKERKRLTSNDLFKNGANFFQPALALTEDGKWLLVSGGRGGDRIPVVWVDTKTGDRVHEINPDKDCRFANARFSRDGRQVIVAEFNDNNGQMRVRVYDAARGTEIRSTDAQANNFGFFMFDPRPDNKTLLVGNGQGGPVRLMDYSGKEFKETRAFSDVAPDGSFEQSRDGKQLFIVNRGKITHWEIDSGNKVREIDAPGASNGDDRFGIRMSMTTLAVSTDNKQLVFSGRNSFTVFEIETGKVKAGGDSGAAVGAVAFTPNGNNVVIGNTDQGVSLWDSKGATKPRAFAKFEDKGPRNPRGFDFFAIFISSMAFSSDGKLVAFSLGENGAGVWDVAKGTPLKRYGPEPDKENLAGGGGFGTAFAFSPRGNLFATSAPGGVIKLWDAAEGKHLRSWQWHSATPVRPEFGNQNDSGMLALAFSPDGKTLAGGGAYNMSDGMPQTVVILWETATGKERLRMRGNIKGLGNDDLGLEFIFQILDQMAFSMSYSPDGKHLIVGTFNGLHVLDAVTGKDVVSFSGRMMLGKTATFSHDGKLLFVGRADGALRIIDVANARVLRDVPAHDEPLLALAVSPDGKTLATGSNDSTVLLWDVADLTKPGGPGIPAKITAKDLDGLWKDLADDDAGKAFKAIAAMTTAPAETAQFLKAQLKPVAPVDQKVLEKLMDDLNSEKYVVREKANVELEKLGDLAGPLLKQRLAAKPSLEMRQRIEKLIAKLNGPVQSPQVVQALRAIEVLERIGNREAMETLTVLAKGAPGHRITEDARDAAERLERLAKAK
jgi:WD40 repeat protein